MKNFEIGRAERLNPFWEPRVFGTLWPLSPQSRPSPTVSPAPVVRVIATVYNPGVCQVTVSLTSLTTPTVYDVKTSLLLSMFESATCTGKG